LTGGSSPGKPTSATRRRCGRRWTPWVEAVDVSNAVLYLASDETRYVTGTTMVIDAGAAQPFKIPHAG